MDHRDACRQENYISKYKKDVSTVYKSHCENIINDTEIVLDIKYSWSVLDRGCLLEDTQA